MRNGAALLGGDPGWNHPDIASWNQYLQHYWALEEPSGTDRVDYISGNDFVDSSGTPTVEGKFENGADMNGNLDHLIAGDVVYGWNQVMLSCWIKFHDVSNDGLTHYVVSETGIFGFYRTSGNIFNLYIRIANGTGKPKASSPVPLVAGNWHHFLALITTNLSFDRYMIYVDGVNYLDLQAGLSAFYTGYGEGNFYLNKNMGGVVDELAIWSKAPSNGTYTVTDASLRPLLTALYNNGAGRFYRP